MLLYVLIQGFIIQKVQLRPTYWSCQYPVPFMLRNCSCQNNSVLNLNVNYVKIEFPLKQCFKTVSSTSFRINSSYSEAAAYRSDEQLQGKREWKCDSDYAENEEMWRRHKQRCENESEMVIKSDCVFLWRRWGQNLSGFLKLRAQPCEMAQEEYFRITEKQDQKLVA